MLIKVYKTFHQHSRFYFILKSEVLPNYNYEKIYFIAYKYLYKMGTSSI